MKGHDQQLWDLAKARVSFRYHIAAYFLVNSMLWFIWFMNDAQGIDEQFPWPIYPLLGWGLGLAFHYLATYKGLGRASIIQEYQKLKKDYKH